MKVPVPEGPFAVVRAVAEPAGERALGEVAWPTPVAASVVTMALRAFDLLGRSYRFATDHLGVFLRTQGVFLLLGGLLGGIAGALLVVQLAGMLLNPGMDAFGGVMAMVVTTLPMLALVGLVTSVGTFFGLGAAEDLRRGRSPTLGSIWEDYGAGFGPFLATVVVSGLLVMRLVVVPVLLGVVGVFVVGDFDGLAIFLLLFVAAVAFAVWLALRWWAAPVVAAFEGGSVEDALRSSSARLRGSVLAVLGVLLGINIPAAILSGVLTAPLDGALAGASPGLAVALASMAGQVVASTRVSLFFGPVLVAALVLAYHDTEPPAVAPAAPVAPVPAAPRSEA